MAPYLLKDGMVQRVTQYKSIDDAKSTIDDIDELEDDYEDEYFQQMNNVEGFMEDQEEEKRGLFVFIQIISARTFTSFSFDSP